MKTKYSIRIAHLVISSMICLSFLLLSCSTSQPLYNNNHFEKSKALEIIPGVFQDQRFFSIIVLPDTQYYSEKYPQVFLSQTRWIVENRERLNIVFVTHSGDIVNDSDNTTQWEFADIALRVLDGAIPYGVLPGNHDQPTELFNDYFGYTRYESYPWYGGHYGSANDNNYELIDIDGNELLFLHLAFSPPPDVLYWAETVLDSYPDRTAILNTHSALSTNGDFTPEGNLLANLFRDAENLRLILCGHVHGEGATSLEFDTRQTPVLLADYQKFEMGGNGYLRILTFTPERNICVVNTYSPWLEKYVEDNDSHFEIEFPLPVAVR